MKQSELLEITCNLLKVREKSRVQDETFTVWDNIFKQLNQSVTWKLT